jgi:prepilin-type N-terminal cleavage/methylation domain-containing protein
VTPASSFRPNEDSRVTRASGFTLLEVMVAIVLTSLIVVLAYSAAQVSYDAHARLSGELRALQQARALRELLQDALRGARVPQRPGDPPFTLHAGRLSFVTAGSGPPLDPDYDWLLTLGPTADGLELSATPVGRVPAAVVTIRVPGVTRWEVWALAPNRSQWLEEWSAPAALPPAVAIKMWHETTPLGLPLQVRLLAGSIRE